MSSDKTVTPATPAAAPAAEANKALVGGKETDVPAQGKVDAVARLNQALECCQNEPIFGPHLKELGELQEKHLRHEEEYRKELNALKYSYFQKFKPLYQERRKVLEKTFAEKEARAQRGEPVQSLEDNVPTQLPEFWLKAMKGHVLLSDMIEEHDYPILEKLIDIEFEWLDVAEQTGFTLTFIFAPNDYFTNETLTKTYYLERAEDDIDESVLTRTVGTTIDWKDPKKNVTRKMVSRRQRNKRTQMVRVVTEAVENNSFFNFFQSHDIPTEDQLESMDDRQLTDLEMVVEAEFEVGCIIRDKIIPRAVGWFLGIERDEELEGSSGGSDDDSSDDDDDDEEGGKRVDEDDDD